MEHDDIKYPEVGDRLFIEGDISEYSLSFSMFAGKPSLYYKSYKKAADIIVKHILEDKSNKDGALLYPVAFLYKHSIELLLKQIAYDGKAVLGGEKKELFGHDLKKLWGICRPILEEIWPDAESVELEATEETINTFCDVDPYSTAFRYHIDKNGNKSLKNIDSPICIINLSEIVNKTYNLLDSCRVGIDDILSNVDNNAY